MHSRGLYVHTAEGGTIDILLVFSDGHEQWLRSINPSEDLITVLDMDYRAYRNRIEYLWDYPLFIEKLDIAVSELEEVICAAKVAAEFLKAFDSVGYFAVTARIDALLETPDNGTASWLIQMGAEVVNALLDPVLTQIRLRNIFDTTFGRTERLTQTERLHILQSRYPDLLDHYYRAKPLPEEEGTPYGKRTEYALGSLLELRILELTMYFSQPQRFARCEHCWGFFLPRTKKETLYCDRVWNGKSCKQVAPKVLRRVEQPNDNALIIYEQLRNRMESRFDRYVNTKKPIKTNYPMDYIAYGDWSEAARDARRAYLEGDITPEEFISVIDIYGEFRDFTSQITIPGNCESNLERMAAADMNFDPATHYFNIQTLNLAEANPQWRTETAQEWKSRDQDNEKSLMDKVAGLDK